MADPRAALLREFVRLRIPQGSAEVKEAIWKARRSRKAQYLWDLRKLTRRKSPYHPEFLRASDIKVAAKRLKDACDHDCEEIEIDPEQPHFQSWRATDTDWRLLAIGLAFERDQPSFGLEEDDSRVGDDHWYFDVVMGNVVKETGGNATKAAFIAAKYINERIDAGEFIRQSLANPKEHVEPEQLRQVYSSRKAARSRHLAGILPVTLDGFAEWAVSAECPVSQDIVAKLLPPKVTITRWIKEDSLAWGRLQAHLDRTAPNVADEAEHEEFQAERRSLLKASKECSAWGRLQAHFDNIVSSIDDDAERKAIGRSRQTLIAAFLRDRHIANDTIMDEMLDQDPLPYNVRRELHVRECFLAAIAAGDSLSVEGEL